MSGLLRKVDTVTVKTGQYWRLQLRENGYVSWEMKMDHISYYMF